MALSSFALSAALVVLTQSAPPDPAANHALATVTVERRDWRGLIGSSIRLLAIEHTTRLLQEKTQAELGGNFWADYSRSVRWPRQWGDTDSLTTNYVGHAIHGAAAGRIWIDHGPRTNAASVLGTFALHDPAYWRSRAAAAAFAGVYSLQFEVGPFSEASIGNVGLHADTAGWVDHVMTPVGAFGWMVAEDAAERFIVRWIEARRARPWVVAVSRMALTPSQSMANLARGARPWNRPGR
jgi:hypothetical protein